MEGLEDRRLLAGVSLDWVTVGDAGNAADTSPSGYGAVIDPYRIMKFEWTNSQYVAFLNAVDPQGTNPNLIYSSSMGSDSLGGITNTGSVDGSRYAVKPNMGDKPVNFVTWFDAARAANWLHKGGQTYDTSSSTAAAPQNSGAYALGAATSGTAPARNEAARFFIPTRDQWYKAAYYKGGSTNAGYWNYATQSDTAPTAVTATATGVGSAGATGNFANYNLTADWNSRDGNVTSVGTNGGPSAYQTFDMSGNIQEWNDLSGAAGSARGLGGGEYRSNSFPISSSGLTPNQSPNITLEYAGFRLASAIDVLGAPANVRGMTGNAEVNLLWSAPSSTGASAITDYVVEYKAGEATGWTTFADGVSTATSTKVTGLTNGVSYVFRVSAVDLGGAGVASVQSAAITPSPAPPVWAVGAGGSGIDRPVGIATLVDGAAIVTGYFEKQATFGSTTLTSPVNRVSIGSRDFFVAKVSRDGAFAWATGAGGTGLANGAAVTTLADGSALVSGNFTGTVTFGTTTLTSTSGSSDVFVAKVLADGTFAWATRMGGASEEYTRSVAALSDGSALVCGTFSGTATFGSTTLSSGGGTDVFVAKLTAAGGFAWATRAGGAGFDYDAGLAAFADGSAIVAGYFNMSGGANGSATFGGTTLTSPGDADVFVAKLNADGTYAWATRAGGSGRDYALDVAAAADGSAFVTGNYAAGAAFGGTTPAGTGGTFVSKLTSTGGFAWTLTPDCSANAVAAMPDGSALIGGSFIGTKTFGGITLSSGSPDYADALVAKIDASGSFVWATKAGNGASSMRTGVQTVEALADGSAVIAGSFAYGGIGTPSSTRIMVGPTTLTGFGSDDVFVAKVSANGSFYAPPNAPTALAAIPDNAAVSLTWTSPAANGSAITDYVVEYKTAAAATWTTFVDGISNGTSAVVTGLTNGTSYVFRVSAVNLGGAGDPSAASAGVTPRTVPGKPSALSGSVGDGRVTLSWSAGSSGGATITDFVVQYRRFDVADWTTFADGVSSSRSAIVTGLTNTVGYVFRVSAVNAAGTGAFSDASSVLTPRGAPGAPTGVVASAQRGYATVSWTAPMSDGGEPISAYVVESSRDGGSTWVRCAEANAAVLSVRVNGLYEPMFDGATYTFRVKATNSLGTGAASVPSAAVTLPRQSGWPVRGGGAGDDAALSVATAGTATLVTGSFVGTATFGGSTLTAAGDADAFIAKLNADGTYAWAVRAGGTGTDRGAEITAFDDGSMVVIGTFTGSATFGSTTLTAPGSDSFIAKVRADGTFSWARRTGTAGTPSATQVASLAGGAAIVTGTYAGSATFGGTTLSTNGMSDAFVAKLDASGSYVWAVRAGAPFVPFNPTNPGSPNLADVFPGGIATLSDGSSYVAGWFSGQVAFGGTSPVSTPSSMDRSIFVAKVSPSGAFQWVRQADPASYASSTRNEVTDVAVLGDRVVVTGTFENALTIGDAYLTGTQAEIFLGEWTADGTPAGAITVGGVGDDFGGSLTSDGFGVLMTGIFDTSASVYPGGFVSGAVTQILGASTNQAFVASYASYGFLSPNPASGSGYFRWATVTPGSRPGFFTAPDVAASSAGLPVIAGQFTQATVFGSAQLSSAGAGDVFVARMTSAGGFDFFAGPPTDVTGIPGDGRVSLTWLSPESTNSPIIDYLVEYSSDGGLTWTAFNDGVSTTTAAIVTGLANDTAYRFRVSTVNEAGVGRPSALSAVLTPTLSRFAGWPKRLDSEFDSMAVLADGSVALGGSFSGTVTFGGTTLVAANPLTNSGTFVTRMSADGSYAWTKESDGSLVAAGTNGATLVAGTKVVSFPDGEYNGMPVYGFSATHMALTRLKVDGFREAQSTTGATPWNSSYPYSQGTIVQPLAMTTLADGTVFVAGYRNDNSGMGMSGGYSVFVEKLGTGGWSRSSSYASYDYGTADIVKSIAAFPDGSTIMVGDLSSTSSQVPFGGDAGYFPFPRPYAVRMTATGSVAWAKPIGTWDPYSFDGSRLDVSNVAALPDGSAIITGWISGTVTIGSTTVAAGGGSALVAKLAADGSLVWAKMPSGVWTANGVAASADGSVLLTGGFTGSITLGTHTLTSAGAEDMFAAKIASDGTFVWARSAGGAGDDRGERIAVGVDGTAVVAGRFSGTAALGGVSLTSSAAQDVFLTKLRSDGSPVISLYDGTHRIDTPATRVDAVGGTASLTLGGSNSLVDSIEGGTVRLIAGGAAINRLSGGQVEVAAASLIIAASGSPAISVAGGAVTEIQSGYVGGSITGAGVIRKTGSGTLTLAGTSSHSGTTLVDDGRLQVTGISGTGTIIVAPDASIGGTGRVAGPLRLEPQATMSPGLRLGTISTADIEIAGGANLDWELGDSKGSPGSGWDVVDSTGTLTLTAANSRTPVLIRAITVAGTGSPNPGPALNFDPARDQRWLLGTFAGGIVGFTPGSIVVDSTSFANSFDVSRAAFFVTRDGGSLYVTYVSDVNAAPTAITLTNVIASLADNTSTAARIKVADITVTDDAYGTNRISLSGTDAAFFEIASSALYLKAGVTLNASLKQRYSVTVQAADPTLPSSSPVTAAYTLSITGSSVTVPGGQTVTDGTTHTGPYQLVKQGSGTLILDKANTHSGGTVVESGTIIVKDASALGTGEVRIKAGATLVIDPAAGEVGAGSLVIDDGGFVDLGTGRIRIVAGMTATALVDDLLRGKGDGSWTTSAGIGSSAVSAAVGMGALRTIGWLDNGDGSFTAGFAAQGDTNMDGAVDILDASNFITSAKYNGGLYASWIDGDFNYDGSLDILDATDFFNSALFGQGIYLVSASAPAAMSATEPVAVAAAEQPSAIDSAFAALAFDTTATPPKRKNPFASFR